MQESTDIIDIKGFRKDVINKLAYKGPSNISKQNVLLKIFKFYDLNSKGTLSREEFLKSIAKIGVVLTTQEEMDELFFLFADPKKKIVNYRNFIEWVLDESIELRGRTYEDSLDNRSSIHQKSIVGGLRQSNVNEEKHNSKIINVQKETTPSEYSQRSVKQSSAKKSVRIKQQLPQPRTFDEVVDWIRYKFRDNEPIYFLDLSVKFKEMDDQKLHKIHTVLIEKELSLLQPHLDTLLQQFSMPGGFINYAELLYCIRGVLSPERSAVLVNIFKQLDSENKQEIEITTLLSKAYKTQFFSNIQFKKAVDLYCQFQGINDGVFTFQDFQDFFGFVGIHFENDEDFRSFVLKTFDEDTARSSIGSRASRRQFSNKDFQPAKSVLEQKSIRSNQIIQTADFSKKPIKPQIQPSQHSSKPQQQNVSQRSRKVQINDQVLEVRKNAGKQIDLILLRIRRKLMSKGPRGFLFFQKFLKQIDIEQECFIDIYNFKKAIKDHRIDITPSECQLVFQVFNDGSDRINYIELVQILKGEVSPKRMSIIERVWQTIKVNEFETTYNEMKRKFDSRFHPDILNGRRFKEDIDKQLYESITCIQDLDGLRSEEINKETFREYLETLSASIEDDQLFESILTNVWKLSSSTKIEDFYAGSKLKFDMNKKQNPYLMDHHRATVSGEAIYQSAPFGTFKNLNEYYRKN